MEGWGSGGQNRHHPPLCAGLLTLTFLISLDVILFTPFVQKISEGEGGEKIW